MCRRGLVWCGALPERLYIVDGHGYIFRAHYGLMNISRGERKEVRLSTSEGMPTGALYVFSRMLMRLEEDFAPRRMAVVFDDKSGVRTFRAEMFAAYKATRKEPPEELQVQMDYFAKVVDGLLAGGQARAPEAHRVGTGLSPR